MNVLLIDKEGNINSQKIKEFKNENLYKKCGFKNNNNFVKNNTWKLVSCEEIKYITLFGKNKGKCNFENKYEFPHPVKNILFGNTILVGYDINNNPHSLTKELWDVAITEINKGFHTLDYFLQEDENEEDELDNVSPENLTNDGYLKDGFVVDSDVEEIDLDNVFQQCELEEEEYNY
jgi:hypothetical protein